MEAGAPVAALEGPARSILTAERTMLNFLSHLSGVATQAAALRRAVEGTGRRVVDTRKTTPGLRSGRSGRWSTAAAATTASGCSTWCSSRTTTWRPPAGCGRPWTGSAPRRLPLHQGGGGGGERGRPARGHRLRGRHHHARQSGSGVAARGWCGRPELRPEVVLEASGGVTLATVRAGGRDRGGSDLHQRPHHGGASRSDLAPVTFVAMRTAPDPGGETMLLAVDVGNTQTVARSLPGKDLAGTGALPPRRSRPATRSPSSSTACSVWTASPRLRSPALAVASVVPRLSGEYAAHGRGASSAWRPSSSARASRPACPSSPATPGRWAPTSSSTPWRPTSCTAAPASPSTSAPPPPSAPCPPRGSTWATPSPRASRSPWTRCPPGPPG